MELCWCRTDITRLAVDAVVTAANSELQGGGGVDGAIHRAAGPELLVACRQLGGCPTGQARITPGFRLPSRWVIHAVGPIWQGGNQHEAALLAGAYRASLELAAQASCQRLAMPAISCGVYGYPVPAAMQIAIDTVRAWTNTAPRQVVIAAIDPAVCRELQSLLGPAVEAATLAPGG